MVSADMCKHDWPGSGCPECREEESRSATPRLLNLTMVMLLAQINNAIQEMDKAFRLLSDHIDDEDPRMKDYQSMIRGAVITKNALERIVTK